MPMTTMFVISPAARPAMYSATISSAASDLTTPCAPDAQKAQPIAQPTCVEMHCVKRPVAGMRTVSTAAPSANPTRSFFVPSDDTDSASVFVSVSGNSDFIVCRRSFGSVVALSQSSIQSR